LWSLFLESDFSSFSSPAIKENYLDIMSAIETHAKVIIKTV